MNELLVMNLDNTDITAWDFSALKAELQAYLADYEGLVYTDETVKDAKKDRTVLNKAKKLVEDARKAYKARCLEPYEAMEPKIKELTDLIEERRRIIDEIVKDYENRQKEAKEMEVRTYYDRVSGSLGADAGQLYQKIFDPKWTNASTTQAKYREAVQLAVASAARDLESIKELGSPFEETLKQLYLETMSMESVLQKNEELKEAAGRAGLMGAPEEAQNAAVTSAALTSAGKAEAACEAGESQGTLVRIHASQARLNQICDFMNAIGVAFEILG